MSVTLIEGRHKKLNLKVDLVIESRFCNRG